MDYEIKYLYKFGIYPDNPQLVKGITKAASVLDKKLESFDLNKLKISTYNKRYFGGYIESHEKRQLSLTKYSYILSWALTHIDKPKGELTFLDYGGGHGILSLLAKQYGIGTVIHNDIYPISSNDARSIGQELGIIANHYITGDIDDILEFSQQKNLNIDVMASYDVIEHIYDIDNFLSKLHLLSQDRMSMFHASAANEQNLRIKRSIRAMQKEFELTDRKLKYGRKPTDTTRALVVLRREIIESYAPELSSEEINLISRLTRGLIEEGIKESVDVYLNTGILPSELEHPTNTCDPLTGNWFEHFMDPNKLVNELNKTGFKTKIICGFYDKPKNLIKRLIKTILNIAIRVMGKHGLYFAPYYALSARK